ncbi:MAG TPA: 6-phosphogluconolactonase, partial [Promineifilum sp.]|nr:6-phosphogluconolactonase [Promineifilum sp.]
MPEPDYHVLADLAEDLLPYITESLGAVIAEKGVVSFVLSGGGTPRDLYRLLGRTSDADGVPWDKVHFFWGDERLVPPDDPGSN